MFHIEANFNVQSDIVFSEKRRPRIHEKPFSQVKPQLKGNALKRRTITFFCDSAFKGTLMQI